MITVFEPGGAGVPSGATATEEEGEGGGGGGGGGEGDEPGHFRISDVTLPTVVIPLTMGHGCLVLSHTTGRQLTHIVYSILDTPHGFA